MFVFDDSIDFQFSFNFFGGQNWKLDQGFSSMIQFYFNWIEASSKIEKCHQKVEFPYSTVETQNQEKC